MEYSFNKSKLPKSESYPLKRSLLDHSLEQAGIKNVAIVSYLRNQRIHEVMRADFHGEHLQGAGAAGSASVTIYSVPNEQRSVTESALLREGVAAIAKWLKKAETAGNTWRFADHHLVLEFSLQSLRQIES